MWLRVIGLVLPLGLDTFAVAAALSIVGLPPRDRVRVTAIFTAFEMGMPLIGFILGAVVGQAVGNAADYLAIAILIALGVFMLWPKGEGEETERLRLLERTRGLASLALGISISTDELAIGFTLGLFRLPIVVIIVLIGVQTILVTQLGLRFGVLLGERVREGAERIAGLVLALLGLVLLVEKLIR